MTDFYVYAIVALLPVAAIMVVVQKNPYHSLVMRGILGAIAALIYSVLGAPDVALTEALVGTLLAITLYAVAVRSSLVLRIGILNSEEAIDQESGDCNFNQLIQELKKVFNAHYVRIELVPYPDRKTLNIAFKEKEIHATVLIEMLDSENLSGSENNVKKCHTATRLQRIYDIIQTELASSLTILSYVNLEEV